MHIILIIDLRKYKIIGITGTMGSGKSTLLNKIRTCSPASIEVLSLDSMVKDLYTLDESFKNRCYKVFGKDNIVDSVSGMIDTKKVGILLFGDFNNTQKKAFLRYLYLKLFWNLSKKVLNAFIFQNRSLIVLEVPLLFETKSLLPFCFPTCTVYVENQEIVMERLKKRNDPSLEKKLKKQMSWQKKVELADFSVKNEGTIEEAFDSFTKGLLQF